MSTHKQKDIIIIQFSLSSRCAWPHSCVEILLNSLTKSKKSTSYHDSFFPLSWLNILHYFQWICCPYKCLTTCKNSTPFPNSYATLQYPPLLKDPSFCIQILAKSQQKELPDTDFALQNFNCELLLRKFWSKILKKISTFLKNCKITYLGQFVSYR